MIRGADPSPQYAPATPLLLRVPPKSQSTIRYPLCSEDLLDKAPSLLHHLLAEIEAGHAQATYQSHPQILATCRQLNADGHGLLYMDKKARIVYHTDPTVSQQHSYSVRTRSVRSPYIYLLKDDQELGDGCLRDAPSSRIFRLVISRPIRDDSEMDRSHRGRRDGATDCWRGKASRDSLHFALHCILGGPVGAISIIHRAVAAQFVDRVAAPPVHNAVFECPPPMPSLLDN